MNTMRYLLVKEFKQILRNKALLPLLFVAPIVQLLVMPLAADYEVKNIKVGVVDLDRSDYSKKLVTKIEFSNYFKLVDYSNSFDASFRYLEKDAADLVLEIPKNFERNLVREKIEKVFIAVNAINGTKAIMGSNYLSLLLADFNKEISTKWKAYEMAEKSPVIEVASLNWFNTWLDYSFYMVPGILVTLVTMVGVYMCSLNIVKEKEIGTIEQINVTPIKKHHFILAKLLPFAVIGLVIFSVGLFGVAGLVYGIYSIGSLWLVYGFLLLFLAAILGIGLLISTYSQTQQQAMSVAFFFMMIFMLMSGLFTSVDSMPAWARFIANCNPVTHFIEVMRMVVLKGSGFSQIKYHFLIMLGFGLLFNGWAIANYKKTS
ncbi:ABC transporter permease [Flavihumibacter sp. UBA7668]|uniref:ABC transporter permease n=1 Tax=Flavihumibacter sp. UBA7668 TaxID=1946542 RepID=UPI0025BDCA6B|nr:ABC transporter permease [Flavihumibacter sp. UBA7668]